MAKKILYWSGIISPRDDLSEFEKVVTDLLQGNYKEANLDLKKCKAYSLYTVKVNRSDRLLFTTVYMDGLRYLLLLEVIKNHKYQHSRILNNPNYLKQYLENEDRRDWKPLRFEDFLSVEASETPHLQDINEQSARPKKPYKCSPYFITTKCI